MSPIHYLLNFIRTLKSGALASVQTQQTLRALRRDMLLLHFASSDRYSDSKRLFRGAYKVFSEGNEDGMIHEIFSRIGSESRQFVEIGVGDGLECNTAFLVTQGWEGTWIDYSAEAVKKARGHFPTYPISIVCEAVTQANVNAILAAQVSETACDLLSIDIDSYDYYLWESITHICPRVVVIEYNASLPPFVRQTIEYLPERQPPVGTNYFGASLGALVELGERKGYSLVGCSLTGVNAFFVRNDLLSDHFCAPYTADNHYEPPRYGLIGQTGHPPAMGRWVNV
jgi:hypothetical protein